MIPISRTNIETGKIEIFTNIYILEKELSGIAYARIKILDKDLFSLTDEEFINLVHSRYYKTMDLLEFKNRLLNQSEIIKQVVYKEYRWLDINEYNKLNGISNSLK